MRLVFCVLASLLLMLPARALLAADSDAIRSAVDDFLRTHVKSLPGKSSYRIDPIDADRLADACDGFDVSMSYGSRPWGKTQVAVSCRGGSWKIRVPVDISVVAEYLVVARPVSAGQKLSEADIRQQRGELSDLPGGILLDKSQAIGRTAIGPLAAGRPLRADMLRQPMAVLQGQSVKLVGTGSGFQVTNEGRALASAVVGQVVQVRLNSGQVLSGIVRADGAVEIRF